MSVVDNPFLSIPPHPSPSLTLTHILPLLTTTATLTHTLTHTLTQYNLLRLSESHSPSTTPSQTKHTIARTISLYWARTLPQHAAATVLLSLSSFIAGIRAIRASRPGSYDRVLAAFGSRFLVASLAVWGWGVLYRDVLGGMARGYERAGIWVAREGDGEDGVKVEQEDRVKAEEEGRGVEEVVDEKILGLLGRWVRLGWWRGVGEGVAVGCFGWVVLEGVRGE